jgi:hypothetical protein
MNTGQAFLTLPPGFTYESASGVFLTEPNGDVPEPGSLALFGSGLTLLGLLRHRPLTTGRAQARKRELRPMTSTEMGKD